MIKPLGSFESKIRLGARNPKIRVIPRIAIKTEDLFLNPVYHHERSQKDMKERFVEERKTKYGKRIVKQIKGKIVIQKIREDKPKQEPKPRRKRRKKKS